MKRTEWLVASAIILAAAACERVGVPTATTIESQDPLFAAGPSGRFRSFRVPTAASWPRHIEAGSDGAMWFTESEFDVSQIGRIDADGNITEFVVPNRFSQPSDIVAGADGALWFTEPSGGPAAAIGRLTTSGVFEEFNPPCGPFSCSITPWGIAATPDGDIWFTETSRNAIGRFVPSTKEFTFYTIPTPGANPSGITLGPDGALWFAEFHGNKIGRIDLAGNITEYPGAVGADRITTGPDGNLWYTAPFENKIGRLSPLDGTITEFTLATPSQPRDIVAGLDGNLWFTKYNADMLSQITPDGVVTDVQRVRGGPWGIGRAADGALWVTQFDGNRVARFALRQ